mgnify:CR=1 FL=1
MVQETSPTHITTAIGAQKYSTIIARRPRIAQTTITAIASTNTTNSPNGAKLNIVVIFNG